MYNQIDTINRLSTKDSDGITIGVNRVIALLMAKNNNYNLCVRELALATVILDQVFINAGDSVESIHSEITKEIKFFKGKRSNIMAYFEATDVIPEILLFALTTAALINRQKTFDTQIQELYSLIRVVKLTELMDLNDRHKLLYKG